MEALIRDHCKALKIDLDVLAQRRPRGEEAATQSATERLLENDKDGVNEIPFYRASEKPYGAFSNLARRPITFEGRVFPTAEHAYQAGKVRKEEVREWLGARGPPPQPATETRAGSPRTATPE